MKAIAGFDYIIGDICVVNNGIAVRASPEHAGRQIIYRINSFNGRSGDEIECFDTGIRSSDCRKHILDIPPPNDNYCVEI